MSERKARVRLPGYRLHKSSGQAIVKLGDRVIYLGEFGTEASKLKYERVVAEWRARGQFLPGGYRPGSRLRVDDLTRSTINGFVSRIRQCFRWGVENELVPGSVAQALAAVRGLQKGRSEARETQPVRPVEETDVEAVLPHVSRQVAAMIQVQLLTGMRPGEVVQMRTGDLDRSGSVWFYRPGSHKNEHHDMERVVQIGPKAQELLRPFLKLDPQAPVFSPKDAEAERNEARRQARKTKLWPSHAKRKKKARSRRKVGDTYDVPAYRRAIARGCELVGVEVWSPNQLRHTAATKIRREHGIEAAQAVLGHRLLDTTQVYAEANLIKARQAMLDLG